MRHGTQRFLSSGTMNISIIFNEDYMRHETQRFLSSGTINISIFFFRFSLLRINC